MTDIIMCKTCDHPIYLHGGEDGCEYMYPNTSKGHGIGGQAITFCGCSNVTGENP